MIYLTEVGAFAEEDFNVFEKAVCDSHVAAFNMFCRDFDQAKHWDEVLSNDYW